MEILAKVRTSTIYLKGDKEVEAVANYMWNKHHVYIYDDKTPTEVATFACNFLMKYHADAVLMEYNGSLFYYPLFKQKQNRK